MTKVSLFYFDVKALGEGVRLMLAYGGQKFEDIRYTHEEFPKVKSKMPFGQMPVLDIDGKKYATCFAICRYLAKKYDLAGDNDEEAFEIDQNIDFFTDIRNMAALAYWETDQKVKANKQEEYSKRYPEMLEKMHNIIEKNNGHIAAKKLTWGDFHVAGIYLYFKVILQIPDFDEKYPAFKKLTDKVYSIPQVKAFADTTPATEY